VFVPGKPSLMFVAKAEGLPLSGAAPEMLELTVNDIQHIISCGALQGNDCIQARDISIPRIITGTDGSGILVAG
jgi:hypothetical protein